MFLLLAVAAVNEISVAPPPPPVVVTVAPPVALSPIVVAAPAGPVTVVIPGHYDCTGDSNDTAACVRDDTQPERPASPAGDQPGATLGSLDPAYGADLTAQLCAVKPWFC